MSYQVLARKWRPKTFDQMIGQTHVLQALINALDSDRMHHAYLFAGTRGVGKTTMARVFAKALNCETGVTSQPCGTCSSCVEVDEGRCIDLIEVDAASRTKVDETRELLENVQYAPTRGRFKVYLIDEVHMFSNHSFNALLKTLEEPPPHVKFLLATTDPKRLPVTILSRCLQFNLKRISVSQLCEHLAFILEQESVPATPASIEFIASAADGSVRDALSLLDQAIAYGNGELKDEEVAAMLGVIGRETLFNLIKGIAGNRAREVIELCRELAQTTPDFGQILNDMLVIIRRVAVYQALGTEAAQLDESDQVTELATRLSPEDCQLLYQIGIMGRRDLPLAPDAQSGFEMVLLRMLAFRPLELNSEFPKVAKPSSVSDQKPNDSSATPAASIAENQSTSSVAGTKESPSAQGGTAGAGEIDTAMAVNQVSSKPVAGGFDWIDTARSLDLSALAREFMRHCAMRDFDGGSLKLVIASQFGNLANKKNIEALENALRKKTGIDIKIHLDVEEHDLATLANVILDEAALEQAAAEAVISENATVKQLQENFGATVERVSSR